MKEFYTYAYLRKDGTPYYIGKGKGDRAWKNCGRKVHPPTDKSRILILKKNLSEAEAFRHEIYMIAVLGRKNVGTGVLHNFTDGGDGTSGHVVTAEMTARRLASRAGYRHSMETRQKMSKAHKGKTHSEESRQKMSEAKQQMTEETKQKIREAVTGFRHSEESKKKIGEASKGRVFSAEHRRKLSEARRRTVETKKRESK